MRELEIKFCFSNINIFYHLLGFGLGFANSFIIANVSVQGRSPTEKTNLHLQDCRYIFTLPVLVFILHHSCQKNILILNLPYKLLADLPAWDKESFQLPLLPHVTPPTFSI